MEVDINKRQINHLVLGHTTLIKIM